MAAAIRHLVAAITCLSLAACAEAPRGAGFRSEVLAATPGTGSGAAEPDFAVVPVSRDTLPTVTRWPQTGAPARPWIRRQEQTASLVIAPGDTVVVTVWDTEENSLLAGPGGRVARIEDLRVSTAGTIFLPFIGEMRVAGMSEAGARARIEDRYADTIPSAQVVLSAAPGRANTADLVGGVAAPGSYPLVDRDVTILTLLAIGGGVRTGMENPQVQLFRGNQAYGISLARLYDDPGLDTTLVGGDRVIVEEDDRTFLSLGAAGSEALHVFPTDRVTALEALSLIGGVADGRADPRGVLVLREYPPEAVRPDGTGPGRARVVFTIDLTTADGLFSARNFEIAPGDLVYATESPVTAAQTVLGLIGSTIGVAARVQG